MSGGVTIRQVRLDTKTNIQRLHGTRNEKLMQIQRSTLTKYAHGSYPGSETFSLRGCPTGEGGSEKINKGVP